MKYFINKYIYTLLAFLMSMHAFAYFTVNGIYYEKTDNEGEVSVISFYQISMKSYKGDIIIPETVENDGDIYSVTKIGSYAFSATGVTSISLPCTIKSIDEYAFYECHQLKTVELSEGLESIGKDAFLGSSIEKIEIPSTVKIIGERAFSGCRNLEIVNMSNCMVRVIQKSTFNQCDKLIKMDMPESLSVIEEQGFYNCSNLQSISFPDSETYIRIGSLAFGGCTNLNVIYSKSKQLRFSLSGTGINSPITIYVPYGAKSNYQNIGINCNIIEVPEVFSLIISSSEGGFVVYDEMIIRNTSKQYDINEGTSISIEFNPDNGYRIKKVIVNDIDVTSSVSGNSFTISNVSSNTKIEVEFEAIPIPTYTLSVKATGNGSATYDGTTAKNSTKSFTLNEGTSATITFSPDNGYRIKSVKVNSTDVTSKVSNNSYTISSISANTTVEVEFEAIPIPTYTLSIKATGNGSATYNGTTAKNSTKTFTLNEGTSATITFTPDNGYRIKSVKVNSKDVTSSVANNQYTVSNIKANTTVEVEFEAIPIPTYTLSIKATGNGSATYNGTTAKNSTKTFTVNEGTSAAITFTPDNGYRIKSVKVNGTNVTSKVSNNSYTISSISANTTLEVEFEAIPVTTYTLSIKATGNGSATYDGTTAKNNTKSFTLNEGTNATITFTPDNGYRIKSVKVNSKDVTSSVSNNQYTVSNIKANTTVEVEFEAIPITTYTLSIKATGNGSATYDGTTAKNNTKTFTLNEGTNATITFAPDNGYRIKSVKVNSKDVTSSVSNNQYTVSNIKANTTVEVEFEAIPITTYTLSIKATGNGSATYNGTTAKNNTQSFTLNEGTSAIITLAPDNGYRIKSVKLNSADVTSSVSNNSYTVSNIKANTTVEVEFEAIPIPTYTLSVKATGNGSATYSGTTAKNNTKTFTLNEGTSATITFAPDNGYRIKSVKVNSVDVTSDVSNKSYTVSNIKANTTVEVEFEAIPINSYTLKYVVDGVTYRTYQIQEGATITPEAYPTKDGYTFSGWSEILQIMPSMDVTVVGTFTKNEPTIKTYTLTIHASGNGSAVYGLTTAKNNSQAITMNQGTSPTITFFPDNGYRIKSVKVNSADVTSWVLNNSYTISSISADTTVEVEFEAIPVSSYTLKYVVDGETYKTYQVQEGAAIIPEADPEKNGYTFSGWSDVPKVMPANDVTVTGTFIKNAPVIKYYTLSLKATGSGSVSYNGIVVENNTQAISIEEGVQAVVKFTPHDGYLIKSATMNGRQIADLSSMSFTIDIMDEDVTIEVEFEAIPVSSYTLKYVIDGETYKTFQIEEGTAISPEAEPTKEGYTFSGWSAIPATMPAKDMIITGSFIVNKYKLTYQVDGEEYKSYSIDYNAAITPEAEPTKEGYSFSGWSEIPATMPANDVTVTGSFAKKGPNISEQGKTYSIAGVNYEVVSTSDLSVVVATGDYKQTLEIPETITYGGYTWDVIGLKDGALDNCDDLAAIIWEPSVAFNARVKNPNLLLYVKSESYKSLGVRNVVVNGVADNIELTDAASGNDFYCPKAFIARNISYSHHYSMETGLGDAKGWETIVLPFDVKKYTSQKGEIVPFAKWTSTGTAKPFWLCELTTNGYREVEGIKANTPYIISMPNNRQYQADYVITGIVTFSAENVEVKASADMQSVSYQDKTFVPNYTNKSDENCFALNVKNYYVNNSSTDKDGSKFIKGLRSVHPFEAYMTTTSNTRSIDVFDGMTTAIREIVVETEGTELVKVYDTRGILMKTVMNTEDMRKGLAPGVYIVNGKKMIIK